MLHSCSTKEKVQKIALPGLLVANCWGILEFCFMKLRCPDMPETAILTKECKIILDLVLAAAHWLSTFTVSLTHLLAFMLQINDKV